MAEIRYGHREGPGKGKEIDVAADQYFHNRGGHFVYVNSSGDCTLCATVTGAPSGDTAASSVFGWLVSPKQADGYNSWKSSATAGADKCFVIFADPNNIFELPADSTTTASLSNIGGGAALIGTGDAAYTRIQQAKYYGTAASCSLMIVDVNPDSTNPTVYVKIKPAVVQITTS